MTFRTPLPPLEHYNTAPLLHLLIIFESFQLCASVSLYLSCEASKAIAHGSWNINKVLYCLFLSAWSYELSLEARSRKETRLTSLNIRIQFVYLASNARCRDHTLVGCEKKANNQGFCRPHWEIKYLGPRKNSTSPGFEDLHNSQRPHRQCRFVGRTKAWVLE